MRISFSLSLSFSPRRYVYNGHNKLVSKIIFEISFCCAGSGRTYVCRSADQSCCCCSMARDVVVITATYTNREEEGNLLEAKNKKEKEEEEDCSGDECNLILTALWLQVEKCYALLRTHNNLFFSSQKSATTDDS